MTSTRKVLAQSSPTTTAEATVYTCGATLGAVISTLWICNLTSLPVTVTLNVCVAGTASAPLNTVLKTTTIPANGFLPITAGWTLANTDVIKITVGTANSIAVTVFGVENS